MPLSCVFRLFCSKAMCEMPKASRKRAPRAPTYVQRIKRELRQKSKVQRAQLAATLRDLRSLGVGKKGKGATLLRR